MNATVVHFVIYENSQTINHEMHQQVHTVFHILYTQRSYPVPVSIATHVLHSLTYLCFRH